MRKRNQFVTGLAVQFTREALKAVGIENIKGFTAEALKAPGSILFFDNNCYNLTTSPITKHGNLIFVELRAEVQS